MTHLLLALPAATGPESPSFINGTKIQGILVFVVSLLLFVVAIKMIATTNRSSETTKTWTPQRRSSPAARPSHCSTPA